MPDTIRKLILENIKAKLEEVSAIETVLLNEFDIRKLETVATPAVFLYPDTNDTVERGSRFEEWTLPLIIELWGHNIEIENIMGEIHKAMTQDSTHGGYANTTERLGGTEIMNYLVQDESYTGFTMHFRVVYEHVLNDPFSQEED
ncbi:MAG: hypothetical protein JXA50_01785 [Deltaproteobacteria bacterium]|nr:hypothetical protein [Deltaproteobacteria bacterium]